MPGQGGRDDQPQCCGVVEEATYKARERRAQKVKQPWIVLKLAIGIAIGILVYATYVYIGRFCAPMIRGDTGALGSRAMGIAFLIVFILFAFMTYWSYLKIILTPPGFARDYVDKSPPPDPRTTAAYRDSWEDGAGWSYEGSTTMEDNTASHSPNAQLRPHTPNDPHAAPFHVSDSGVHNESNPNINLEKSKRDSTSADPHTPITPITRQETPHPQPGDDDPGVDVGDFLAVPPVAAARAADAPDAANVAPTQARADPARLKSESVANVVQSQYRRAPPTTPILLPEFRYCHREGFVKPFRAHHCRSCGTCVLRFDHHCPWIGQCVGAFNHRFFFIFCEWAALFGLWVFSTLLAQNVKAAKNSNTNVDVDPQQIAIIALAGLFSMFTCAMVASHTHLITLNMTTVEHLGVQRMKERERAMLKRAFPWWRTYAKVRVKQEWDREWGRIGAEGNLWWLGGSRANWESVMGKRVWEWFLPIGRSPINGLEYPKNPRFDEQGRWRPRREWPEELR